MPKVLLAWIGRTDLNAVKGVPEAGIGPIGQAVTARTYDAVSLLSDYGDTETKGYVKWLKRQGVPTISVRRVKLSNPINFEEIYPSAVAAVEDVLRRYGADTGLTYHLSPGTPAMAAIWAIIAKTRFPAELIQSSREHGVQTASLPFDMSPEFITDLLRKPDEELRRLMEGLPGEAPEFDAIIRRGTAMKRVVALARRAAPRDAPVLIQGETGTGKELLAEAIHKASPWSNGPFISVNCAAIPPDLFESEFFGHKKGSFSGAVQDRPGHFEAANGGTLFLDEVAELPLHVQAKLLRALEQRKVTRVGESTPRSVQVRVISATNRDLIKEVAEDRFREDLFYRLAVAVLPIPPLRERREDLEALIDHVLDQVNQVAASQPGYESKTLSAGARLLLIRHPWPGNVRELYHTILRASIWSTGATIAPQDIRGVLLSTPAKKASNLLDRPLGDGFKIEELIRDVKRRYVDRALAESGGNKSKAAQLLGLGSHQTLSNWMKGIGLKS